MINNSDCCHVGIVTLDSHFNYGNRLQAFAVQQIVKSMGCCPTTLKSIELSPEQSAKRMVKRILRKPVSIEAGLSTERRRSFEEFEGYIASETIVPGNNLDSKFDVFIAGSDQIWNPRFMAYRHPELLPFASPHKRVALAASFGVSEIPTHCRSWLARGIKGFKRISVREYRAIEIVRNLTGRDVALVIDPTLVLNDTEWRNVSCDRFTPGTPYVFTYLLGGFNQNAREVLSSLTHGQTALVSITDRESKGELPAGPSEFISLIDNAKHVVTDSYHASVFSLLMGTPLTIVRRQTANSANDMFSRLESLVTLLALKHLVFGSDEFQPVRSSDYACSLELLNKERAKFIAFLSEALVC